VGRAEPDWFLEPKSDQMSLPGKGSAGRKAMTFLIVGATLGTACTPPEPSSSARLEDALHSPKPSAAASNESPPAIRQHKPKDASTLPGDPLDVTGIAEQVSALRGLPIKQGITARVLGQREWRAETRDSGLLAQDPQFELMKAIGLVASDLDLDKELDNFVADAALGLYLPSEEVIYVNGRPGIPRALRELAIAHEVTHALQDQNYDLGDDVILDRDLYLARQALIEGDALRVESRWSAANQTSAQRRVIAATLRGRSARGSSRLGSLRTLLYFPYLQGVRFVDRIVEEGGLNALDEAFRNPPITTEQILHVDSYLRLEPIHGRTFPRSPGPRWTEVMHSNFGELDLLMMLQPLGALPARQVASGWGSGNMAVWATSFDVALSMALHFDTPRDLGEMCRAMPRWYGRATGARLVGRNLLTTGAQWLAFRCERDESNLGFILLAIAPTARAAERAIGKP
jgi:hypothetical protein